MGIYGGVSGGRVDRTKELQSKGFGGRKKIKINTHLKPG